MGTDPGLREARTLITGWGGRAASDSAGYRIVRAFRRAVSDRAFAPLIAPALKKDPRFLFSKLWQSEGPLWALITEKPLHLLDPKYADWHALLADSIQAVVLDLTTGGRPLAERTWGERNTARIQHPLSRAVPSLARFLDMKKDPLPGDDNMPRVHTPTNGASERFVVSPGHEDAGLLPHAHGPELRIRSPPTSEPAMTRG